MRKTLYVRVVLTFLAAILIAIVASTLIGLALFENELDHLQRDEIVLLGENIIHVYEQTTPANLASFMQSISKITSNPICVYSDSEEICAPRQATGRIPPETVRIVLSGERYLPAADADLAFIGLPFQEKAKSRALFLLPSSKNEDTITRLFLTVLLLVLITGSMCILIAARYLVQPIKALTQATKQLAKGHYDIELKLNRKDELGTLANSFTEMAGELKQLEKMRQDFVSNVSHEIQTPLTSISGFAKALKYDQLINEQNRSRYLDIILMESERLSRLSEHLLKLASLESEHHPFAASTFHLDEQIRLVVVASEPLWSAKDIRVDLNLPVAAKITADADQLNQVWTNLLGNSIKFTPEGGTIGIELTKHGNKYFVNITDSGIGIPPNELSHIFVRFYKTDRSRTGRKGSGLGLAIVKRIIALHHGSIDVQSAVGEGTTIKVTLPILRND